ncbi:MAG TPA: fluoride efflux transporter CrcB [Ruminiclostridium sp.]|nr:fluoride efflux transporter CrcB [Ruminiclostridium sp.]
MNKIIIVGLGGFIGSSLRFIVSYFSSKFFGNNFPSGTLIVNFVGCLLMGFIMNVIPNSDMRLFLTTGILGGFTTFSTFSYETVSLISEGRVLMGGLNAGLNLSFAIAGAYVGKALASLI